MRKDFVSQSGQALLIVVLLLVVVSTIGLAAVSRSITNVRSSQEDIDSNKAFSAAEAGVEQALKTKSNITSAIDLGNNASISNVSQTSINGSAFAMLGGSPLTQNEGADMWFVKPNANGDINYPTSSTATYTVSLTWSSTAAIEVIVISGTSPDTATTHRYAFDPQNSGVPVRTSLNSFCTVGGANCAVGSSLTKNSGNNTATFVTDVNPIVARIVPLYTDAAVSVSSSNFTFPDQGIKITSTGSAGGTERQVVYYQGYPMLPSELFQYIMLVPKG